MVFERRSGLELHVLENLRQGHEKIAYLAHRFAEAHHFRQDLQCRQQAITRRREIRQDDMARLLAADIEALAAHMFRHITVAHLGARQRQIFSGQKPLEAEIGHDGGDQSATLQQSTRRP